MSRTRAGVVVSEFIETSAYDEGMPVLSWTQAYERANKQVGQALVTWQRHNTGDFLCA